MDSGTRIRCLTSVNLNDELINQNDQTAKSLQDICQFVYLEDKSSCPNSLPADAINDVTFGVKARHLNFNGDVC